MLKRIIISMVLLGVLVGTANGLGMLDVTFGNVEQGKTYTQSVTLINSERDFDNHFVIEIGGELKDWMSVTPMEFDLAKGKNKVLNVTLTIPEDAILKEYTGTITAVGKKTVPIAGENTEGGAAVGYTIATKSRVYANVVKPSAVESVAIINIDAPKRVAPGDIAKFGITIKNTGNIPTSADSVLTISKGSDIIVTIPSAPIKLAVGEEKILKLYWDTQDVAEGKYSAVASVTIVSVATGKEVTKTSKSDVVSIVVGSAPKKSNLLLMGIIAFVVVMIIIGAVFIIKRKKEEEKKEDKEI
ncbi:MAG: hypothetical protein ACE5KT_01515 [Methanosarcinales archaeon]